MKNCQNCGTVLEDHVKFCHNCGEPQQQAQKQEEVMKKVCSNCGVQLEGNAKFCPECGTHQNKVETQKSDNVPKNESTKESLVKKINVLECSIDNEWTMLDSPDGEIIRIQYVNNTYFAFIKRESYRDYHLYMSNNLFDWEHLFEMDDVSDEHTHIIHYENNRNKLYLVIANDDKIYCSKDLKTYTQIDLPCISSDDCLYFYHKIIFKDGKWQLMAELHSRFSYTNKGFFSDSIKELGCDYVNIYEGETLESLSLKSSKDIFPRGCIGMHNMTILNDSFYGMVYDHDKFCKGMGYSLVTYSDGRYVKLCTFDEAVCYLTSLNGKLYTEFDEKIYMIDEKHSRLIQNCSKNGKGLYRHQIFEQYGVALIYNDCKNDFYITNDFSSYKTIFSPIEVTGSTSTIGGDNTVIVWPYRYSKYEKYSNKFFFLKIRQ